MADRESVGDLHLRTVVINVQDMTRTVAFWSAVLGYVPRERDWDPEFMMLIDPPYPDGADFIVMRDPDGNEFCVIDHPGR
jgi:catechol 2,3-dioxygenase-like lactoylglutathione lyase family enzyme